MLPRAKKGSNNLQKLKDKLGEVHEMINNQSFDFLHKPSRMYINEHDLICIENLGVKELKVLVESLYL